MKKINRLIKKVKAFSGSLLKECFPGNDDGFMDALGVELEKYERVASDGTIGYDFLAALNDTAKECWES